MKNEDTMTSLLKAQPLGRELADITQSPEADTVHFACPGQSVTINIMARGNLKNTPICHDNNNRRPLD